MSECSSHVMPRWSLCLTFGNSFFWEDTLELELDGGQLQRNVINLRRVVGDDRTLVTFN